MFNPSRPAPTAAARSKTRARGANRGLFAADDRRLAAPRPIASRCRHDADSGSSCVERRGTRKKPSRMVGAKSSRASLERNRRTDVGPERKSRRADVRRSVDPRCIDLRQHVHVLEDRVQLRDERRCALVVESEARERGDVANVVERDGHYSSPRSRLACAMTSVLRPIVSSSKSILTFASRPVPDELGDRAAAELSVLHARADRRTAARPATRLRPRRRAQIRRPAFLAVALPGDGRPEIVARPSRATAASLRRAEAASVAAVVASAGAHDRATGAPHFDRAPLLDHRVGNRVEEARLARRQQLAIPPALFGEARCTASARRA